MKLKETRGTLPLREMVRRIDRRSIDVPMLSKLEHGVCLPTVEAMPDLERAYGLPRDALYDPAELDFGLSASPAPQESHKRDRHKLTHKKTFRVPDGLAKVLTPEILHTCGYATAQDWFCACVRRLQAQHSAICRHRKELDP